MGKRRRRKGETWRDRARPEAILRQSFGNAARVTRLVRDAERGVTGFVADPARFAKKRRRRK